MVQRRISREQLIERLREIKARGWIDSVRPRSAGGVGNTIEHLLGFPDNNLPIADTAQWELKSHRRGSSTLLTLLHFEPHPRPARIVPRVLLPNYGWPDAKGRPNESSFRQTIRSTVWSDRGFRIVVDREGQRVVVVFDSAAVEASRADWLRTVAARTGLGPLNPQPYWPLQDVELKVSSKMLNTVLVEVDSEKTRGAEQFRIHSVHALQGFNIEGFISAIESGDVYIDFDARTGHNHGTKFRLRQGALPRLYRYTEQAL